MRCRRYNPVSCLPMYKRRICHHPIDKTQTGTLKTTGTKTSKSLRTILLAIKVSPFNESLNASCVAARLVSNEVRQQRKLGVLPPRQLEPR